MDYRGNIPPPFAVRTAGVIFRRPQHSSPGTKGDDCMLVVVLSGRGIYSLENRETSLHGGMVGLFVPERPGVLMADPDKPYRLLYCRFGGRYARHMVDLVHAQGKAPFFAWPAIRELAGLIRGMGYVKRANLPEAMGIPEVLLAECLVSLCGGPAQLSDPSPLTTFAIHDWLQNHVSQPTDLDRMARDFGVSRSTLSRMVRRLTGSSVQLLHKKAKMDWAVHLFRHTGLNIKQVAHRLGYPDPLYFTRVFRKHHRVSPSLWRRRHIRPRPPANPPGAYRRRRGLPRRGDGRRLGRRSPESVEGAKSGCPQFVARRSHGEASARRRGLRGPRESAFRLARAHLSAVVVERKRHAEAEGDAGAAGYAPAAPAALVRRSPEQSACVGGTKRSGPISTRLSRVPQRSRYSGEDGRELRATPLFSRHPTASSRLTTLARLTGVSTGATSRPWRSPSRDKVR